MPRIVVIAGSGDSVSKDAVSKDAVSKDAVSDLLLADFVDCATIGEARLLSPDDDLKALAAGADITLILVPTEVHGRLEVEKTHRLARDFRGVAHVVLLSSAAVYEPSCHHPGLVSEQQPLKRRTGNARSAAFRQLEDQVSQALHGSETVLTILRPAPTLADAAWHGLLRGRIACVPAGFDPTVQLLAGTDLTAAVRRAVESRAAGVFHLAPSACIPLRQALRASRTWRLPMPWSWLYLWRKMLAPFGARPAENLDFLRYPSTVSGRKIERELGFEPSRSSLETIREVFKTSEPATPESDFDDYGFDKRYIQRLSRFFFPFLHDFWWRIEVRGLEQVPRQGGAILTGVHRGFQPWDGVMAMYLLTRELARTPRFLIHPGLVKFPFLAPYMIKCGGIHASIENADWVLERGRLLAIFPEGIRGAFRKYKKKSIYQIGKLGRDEYVKMALRHQIPIVPFVSVGPAEIFPILAKIQWRWWKRYSEWPCLPVTPTMGTVPLPSKWHTWFLEPIHVEDLYPPEAADDRQIVQTISAEVKQRMQAALDDMVQRRRSVFHGSIWRRASEPQPVEGEA